MKRLLALMLCLVLLSGCTTPPPATTVPPQTTAPPQTTIPTTEPSIPPATVSPQVLDLRENLPIMDGSTSLIPLEAGIRAAIFDISIEEATEQVAHSSTWSSFYNLLNGTAELIFSCPLSQEQWETAEREQLTLEAVPVAMEGFVFVVNAQNPVESLTQQQLRDIYSGKITNWKEVGGLDLPIIPYQRNTDSGSQNYMIEFMADTPLMDAPVEMRPATMEGLMDVVAVNDNALGAIGYSVYAYAADMYGNGNEIKFIHVDGVAPDKQTMASGEYPLLGKNYAVFRGDTPADSNIRSLVEWITSYDGQLAIAKAGYVTLEDIGFDYQEARLALWQGTGTGAAAESPASYEWVATQVKPTEWGDEYSELLPVEVENGICRLYGLTDQALQDQINAFIEAQMEWVPGERERLVRWVALQNRGEEFGPYSPDVPWELGSFLPEGLDCSCIVTAKNGYISVAVSVCGANNMMESVYLPYRTVTATWDLLTGQRLEPEDLFCRGVDIDEVLNERVRSYSLNPTDSWGIYPNMKQDFLALPTTGWHLTHDAIYIDQGNPYFATGTRIPLTDLPDGTLVTETPRDFTAAIDHALVRVHKSWRLSERDIRYAYNSDALVSCGFLKEEVHPHAAKINAEVLDHLNTHFTLAAITEFYAQYHVDISDVEVWMIDWDLRNLGSKYLVFTGNAPYHITQDPAEQIRYPAATAMVYDLETGEQMDWTELLLPGWRENAQDVSSQPDWDPATIPEGELELLGLYPYRDGSLYVSFLHGGLEYSATIPCDYVNYQ